MLADEDNEHFRKLAASIFTPSEGERSPRWLAAQARRCSSHYDGIRLTPHFDAALRQFHHHSEHPFEVFVVGEGNFGKSTLVNALLGQEISKVDFRPETRSFHRYILKQKPTDAARLFIRYEPQMHDWLRSRVGDGVRSEIFNAFEYTINRGTADELLDQDIEKCRVAEQANAAERKKVIKAELRGESYTPAFDPYSPGILEIERELKWSGDSLFAEGVRLVDTQGLNQLFDDDLLSKAGNEPLTTGVERFERWIHTSPRGKHIDFQFRRCDGVLWLIHAGKVESAATLAAMSYLKKYGKATVIAVTNIDTQRDSDRPKILQKVKERYGQFASAIVSINGKLAMQSSFTCDEKNIESSGLASLVGSIRDACLSNSARVRAVGQYVSLKTTETQLRDALAKSIEEIESVYNRIATYRKAVPERTRAIQVAMEVKLKRSSEVQLNSMLSKVDYITLNDGKDESKRVLSVDTAVGNYNNMVLAACVSANNELASFADEICSSEYALPAFDAEGRQYGRSITARDMSKPIAITQASLSINLNFSLGFWNWLWKLSGLMPQSTKLRLTSEKRAEFRKQVREQWSPFASRRVEAITKQIQAIEGQMVSSLDRVEHELESLQGEKLDQTKNRLKTLLRERCITSCFVTAVVAVFRQRRRISS
jgi:GTP-binding protein EngB required for normal cell division